MFSNCQLGGMDIGFPDVCKTPIPPIPWPNMAIGPVTVPIPFNSLLGGVPIHNLLSIRPTSFGDTPGIGLGVLCPMVMGPHRHLTGMFTYINRAAPVTRMTSIGITNGWNCPISIRLMPSQFKELLLGP
ncbi:hypothetical protein AAEX37_01585 [Oligella sp. MSHR50489EDL]|uniref:DUF4150 domain-containing protein n=1 Tax=Oligella sp. MSHR50489EDL TaxID=3139409 RepID=UPI003D814025